MPTRIVLSEDMSQADSAGGARSAQDWRSRVGGDGWADLDRGDFLGNVRFMQLHGWRDDETANTAHNLTFALTEDAAEPLLHTHLIQLSGGAPGLLQAARAEVESIQQPSGPLQLYLLAAHNAGADTVVLWQLPTSEAPVQNQALWLETGSNAELIRIRPVSTATRTIVADPSVCGTYTYREITCTLVSPLQFDHAGDDPHCQNLNTPGTLVRRSRRTSQAFFGVSSLAEDASTGSYDVRLASVYGQIVPAAYAETGFSNYAPLSVAAVSVTSGGATFELSTPANTASIAITDANRAKTYALAMQPEPSQASPAIADVVILDDWQTLTEGEDSDYGSVSVTYGAGVGQVSLTEFPTVDTSLLAQWASPAHYRDRAGAAASIDSNLTVALELPSTPEAGTLTITGAVGGVAKTATEASNGALSGDWTGVRVGRTVLLDLGAAIPDQETGLAYSYDPVATVTETLTATATGADVALTLSQAARPGSLELTIPVKRTEVAWRKQSDLVIVTRY